MGSECVFRQMEPANPHIALKRQVDWRIAIERQCWACTNGVRQDGQGEAPGLARRGPARHPVRQRPSGLLLRSRRLSVLPAGLARGGMAVRLPGACLALMANHAQSRPGPDRRHAIACASRSRRKCPPDTYQRGFRIGRFALRFSCGRSGREC